ncbi:MAG: HEAT repeat domain-containing protein [Caldilineaceae bacterium]
MYTSQAETESSNIPDAPQRYISDQGTTIERLSTHPTPENLKKLVDMMEDADFGVRWEAAAALASLGFDALRPVLQALCERSSAWLREGAHHVFYYSSSAIVRAKAAELLKAMRGPAADIATMQMAGKLLSTL